jgi:general L-amino acid transport system permease protein
MTAEPTFWQACWSTKPRAITTVLLALALLWLLGPVWSWGVWHAVWTPDLPACEAARGTGACWGVIAEKHRVILWGRYPFEQQWRPTCASLIMLALLVHTARPAAWRRSLVHVWCAGGMCVWLLMSGRLAGFSLAPIGLPPVATDLWGGLALTLMLAIASIGLAFPLSIGLALGRRSKLPICKALCAGLIELLRGVPLVSVLFMASFMVPMWLPAGQSPDVLWRVLAALVLFLAAYLAEVVRGGLQGVSEGQQQAATALGLTHWQCHRQVLLPQALAHSLPALVNHFIGLFKDTSLVTIVSLYELSGALNLALSGDANWRPYKIEAYLFIALIYFCFCFSLSTYSQGWQQRLAHRTS